MNYDPNQYNPQPQQPYQPQPQPQPQYQQPQPQPQYQPPQPQYTQPEPQYPQVQTVEGAAPKKPFAIWSLILGIFSLLPFCCSPILCLVGGILAIVFAKKSDDNGEDAGNMAKIGKILGIIGIVLSAISIVVSIILTATGAMSNIVQEMSSSMY